MAEAMLEAGEDYTYRAAFRKLHPLVPGSARELKGLETELLTGLPHDGCCVQPPSKVQGRAAEGSRRQASPHAPCRSSRLPPGYAPLRHPARPRLCRAGLKKTEHARG